MKTHYLETISILIDKNEVDFMSINHQCLADTGRINKICNINSDEAYGINQEEV